MRYLFVLVFTTGAVTLGMELSASRLLEPVFGNNQIVWASIIGLLLLYLSVGAWLGGRLADRFPRQRELDLLLTMAAIGVALIPALSRPVLGVAARSLASFATGPLTGSLVAVLALFSLPGILLGTSAPWALRILVVDVEHTGQTAGRLYATATAGSIFGTFLPVLWLIPIVGTRWTFYVLALALLIVVFSGSLRLPHRWIPMSAIVLVLLLAIATRPSSTINAGWHESQGTIIYEDESLYNYIVVRRWHNEHHLKLNEGIGLHSVYHPTEVMSRGIWDYFLLAPLFRGENALPHSSSKLLLIGLAAGTVSQLYTNMYGPIPITGIELDPAIIDVGRRYFAMDQPNLTAIAADGRSWLSRQPADSRWDIIAVDAYRPPYIPFHLTTVEFFRMAHAHLQPDGVLAINVGRTDTNFALVDALAATASTVFPSIWIIDEPGPPHTLANSLLVATAQSTEFSQFQDAVATLPASLPIEFRTFAEQSTARVRRATPPPSAPIFTDDRAPVEQVVHSIIVDYLRIP